MKNDPVIVAFVGGVLTAGFTVAALFFLRFWKRTGDRLFLTFAGAFLFFPTFSGLMNGQDDALLLLGAALCLAGLRSGRDVEAGLGLSLTTIRPQIALFLAIPFLFRRQKIFLGFAAGAAALGLLSLALVGLDGIADFAASSVQINSN